MGYPVIKRIYPLGVFVKVILQIFFYLGNDRLLFTGTYDLRGRSTFFRGMYTMSANPFPVGSSLCIMYFVLAE